MRIFFGILLIIFAVALFIGYITSINDEGSEMLFGASGTFAVIGGLLIRSARQRKEEEEERKNFDK